MTHFFLFPSLGQVNKTEKEIAEEKCNLEKELAKSKVFHILFVVMSLYLIPSVLLPPVSAYLNEEMGYFVEYQNMGEIEKPRSWMHLEHSSHFSIRLRLGNVCLLSISCLPVSHHCLGP